MSSDTNGSGVEERNSSLLAERRWLLGVLSILLLAAGLIIVYAEPWGGKALPMGSGCLRVGIVLAATWLALPDLKNIPKWMFGSLLLAVVVVVWRPTTVVFVAPALLLLWGLRGIAKTVK